MRKKVSVGANSRREVDRQAKFIDDPTVTEYVNRVGQNLVLHSDAKIPFTIKVIDSDEVNAFALPGGFFYVNKGLLLAADNEAEIAGVMAHEIAHVAARHAMENIAKANLWQGIAMAGSIFLGGIPGLIYQNTAGLGLAALFSKFGRSAESEADKRRSILRRRLRYGRAATMFEKLASKNRRSRLPRQDVVRTLSRSKAASVADIVRGFPDARNTSQHVGIPARQRDAAALSNAKLRPPETSRAAKKARAADLEASPRPHPKTRHTALRASKRPRPKRKRSESRLRPRPPKP